MPEELKYDRPIRIPKELHKYGRVTIYAGSSERRERLIQLLELGQGRSLSEMIDRAVTEFLRRRSR